jgi:hypothetical protein
MNGELIISGIQTVAKEWTKQRKAEERQANAWLRRATMWKSRRISIKEACRRYMEQALPGYRPSGDVCHPAAGSGDDRETP